MSIEEGREFWSFKPVASPSLPEVQRRDWVRTPIDAFVLAQLEARGLEPAPPADKRTLIRRVTFDLTGLPPTPEEVDAFLADESPDAFEKVVERLLSSPGYGVRWGRHWLDVARYADSNGLDENLAFGNAWRYRDYVVDAFNNDKPFDRFLIEQIAGDLLPEANEETRTATGFLALGAKVLAEPDREKLEMDTIDEQLDTMGKAFLGMTLGCARCHDHKFDPLKQTRLLRAGRDLQEHEDVWRHEHRRRSSTGTSTRSPRTEQQKDLEEIDKQIADAESGRHDVQDGGDRQAARAARAKAAEYLLAAAKFDPSMPLTQIESIAEPLGLHPYILHHCRLHLEYHRDDPFFGQWHELAAAGDVEGIDRHYRPLFAEAESGARRARSKGLRSDQSLDDPRLEPARAALYDAAGFWQSRRSRSLRSMPRRWPSTTAWPKRRGSLESNAPDAPAAMGVADGKVHTELPIHIRGNHRNLGQAGGSRFSGSHADSGSHGRRCRPIRAAGWNSPAGWPSAEHPLTARVYVNRVWRWHFGAGLVARPRTSAFRRSRRRIRNCSIGWPAISSRTAGRPKTLHRLILASNTYQMASRHPAEAAARRISIRRTACCGSFACQRLEAEQIRDAILAVSGRLDESLGGKTVPLRNRQFVFDHTSIDHTKYDSLRRALYLPVIRNNLYTLFEQFDFPDPTMPTGSRNATVVAPQALLLMNSELVMDSADALASLC